ncbi:energy transducer TonB [Polaromonas sp.]|jgi:protein TonB|uniref:energy transducer TonB n=1 Tax=Polaromonas sp. TaxID=1869339 RepID=UPI002B7432DE|nr:energy transducer TonB [Polaromonas sp.]HQS31673.1 energy transducer TonB [Polaromonas sp.]HQS92951.1 energy transducer TonB [Polaromonas sp.]
MMLPINTVSASTRTSQPAGRYALVACAVVALHIGMLWLVQKGLVLQPAKPVVLVEVMARLIEPPAPAAPTAPALPKAAAPVEPPRALPRAPRPPPVQPRQQAAARPAAPPAPPAPSTEPPPAAVAPAAPAAPVAAAPTAAAPAVKPAPPSPPAVQLPSSDADYLQNPPPPYPSLSKRLNEQGKTIVKVLIGPDGLPQRAEIARSSGFDRLDQAALATVMRWRYVPGKRGGVAEAMWFNVPINWVLE